MGFLVKCMQRKGIVARRSIIKLVRKQRQAIFLTSLTGLYSTSSLYHWKKFRSISIQNTTSTKLFKTTLLFLVGNPKAAMYVAEKVLQIASIIIRKLNTCLGLASGEKVSLFSCWNRSLAFSSPSTKRLVLDVSKVSYLFNLSTWSTILSLSQLG